MEKLFQNARHVLQTEAAALITLSENLPDCFGELISAIAMARGRVIVSGIGKSGHIGRKIAATLASTGTPAYFVHSTEASHGDLGMITPDDFCILISNSGETIELHDMVAHAKRFSIPMAVITSKGHSTLAKAADFLLLLPNVSEACPIGMAPTTSTTLSMALGDAIAVALMEKQGFEKANFKVFHPGGKIGAQMLSVGQLMHSGDALPLVSTTAPMSEALLIMTSKGFGLAAVTDNNHLVGVITDGDLRRHMNGLLDQTAGHIANPSPITLSEDHFAAEALHVMNVNKISVLLVVKDSIPIGIIHIHDLLRAGVI